MAMDSIGQPGDSWTIEYDLALLSQVYWEHERRSIPSDIKDQLQRGLQVVYCCGDCSPIKDILGFQLNRDECETYGESLGRFSTRKSGGIEAELQRLFGLKAMPIRKQACVSSLLEDEYTIFSAPLFSSVNQELRKYQDLTVSESRLLKKNRKETNGIIGLEWLQVYKYVLFVYTDAWNTDFADMYLYVLESARKCGKTIPDYLKVRANNREANLLYIDTKDRWRWIPIQPDAIINISNNPISIVTSLLLAEIVSMLTDYFETQLKPNTFFEELDSFCFTVQCFIKQYDQLVERGILTTTSVLDKLRSQHERLVAWKDKVAGSIRQYLPDIDPDMLQSYNLGDLWAAVLSRGVVPIEQCLETPGLISSINNKINQIETSLSRLQEYICSFPPFHVRMSTLYELYVYFKVHALCLKESHTEALYQVKLKKRTPDVLVKKGDSVKCIIDAKYKEYDNGEVKKEDFGQASHFLDELNPQPVDGAYLAYPSADATIPTSLDKYLSQATPAIPHNTQPIYLLPTPLPKIH